MTQAKLVKVAFYCGIRKVGFIVTPTQHAVNMFNKVIKQYICKMCVSICNEKIMHFEGAYKCNKYKVPTHIRLLFYHPHLVFCQVILSLVASSFVEQLHTTVSFTQPPCNVDVFLYDICIIKSWL